MSFEKENLKVSEPWVAYFEEEIKKGRQNGDGANRFDQYLVRFQGAPSSVYVSDLVDHGSGVLGL